MPSSVVHLTSHELYNRLQSQKNWPSGVPLVLDLRPEGKRRIIRGSHRAQIGGAAVEVVGLPALAWAGKSVCLYDAEPDHIETHPVVQTLLQSGDCTEILLLAEPMHQFEQLYPFLCAKSDSSKAAKRSIFPSCIVPGLLYLGDLTDAAALPRLREQLNVQVAITALAELPPSLRASVADSGVEHTWCNVRDVEEADIKEHFAVAFDKIEAARERGHAVFVHCSRGVSRSASLCIAYLMRKEGWGVAQARERVHGARPIVLPNDGFVRCLREFEKELSGGRSGVYVPAKTKRLEESEYELPPPWAAEPTHSRAVLAVEKAGEELESLRVGEHQMYTFGRSLTCDFQLDHPSISRQHAVLVHHANGGLYVIDLKSSHGTAVDSRVLRPYEATLLREGGRIAFGASSRVYRLEGMNPEPADDGAARGGTRAEGGARKGEAVSFGPLLPGEAPKRKYTPQDAKNKKRQRWLNGPKSSSQMSENERVARGAGAGSGCMGPGFG